MRRPAWGAGAGSVLVLVVVVVVVEVVASEWVAYALELVVQWTNISSGGSVKNN